ncbi:DUF397 domain-containing protein [Streptomyces chattanoogensis]|uniref:DUF397 domain-containing protein n=1 Tax=Streptomyces chattanoogensis TaxID=66876 RepID=UPI00367D30D1
MTQESSPSAGASELEGALWHKSTYSGTNNGCVERGKLLTGRQAVRDTKDRDRGALIFDAGVWQSFVNAIRGGTL